MDREVFKAWFANGGVLAFVTLTQAELALKCTLLALTIAYTVRRWWMAEKRAKRGETFETQEFKQKYGDE